MIQSDDDGRLQTTDICNSDPIYFLSERSEPVMLKTDCQGADFEVIKGGTRMLGLCDLVIMELSLYKFLGEHHPDPVKTISYMNQMGIVIYDFLDGLFRPFNNALGKIDIAFFGKNGMLRKSNRWN